MARGNLFDIDHAHERIARRLDQNNGRSTLQSKRQRLIVILIDERDAKLLTVPPGGQQAVCAAIAIMGGDDKFVMFQLRQDQVDCRHPGGHHNRAGASFQLGKGIGQHIPAGIGRAGIVISAPLPETCESKRCSTDKSAA